MLHRWIRQVKKWLDERRGVSLQVAFVTAGLTPRRSPRRRLYLEQLEDRLAPATGLTGGNQALMQSYGQLPISFEANVGQTDAQVQYLARGSGYALFLTSTGAVLNLQSQSSGEPGASATGVLLASSLPPVAYAPGSPMSFATTNVALAMNMVGANLQATVIGQDQLPGTSNYFIGNDATQWHTGITNYGQVAYQDVYPGVNLVYYGNQQQLEYDFVVAPGADPGSIHFAIQGADSISLDGQGDLVLSTALGDVVEHAPVIFQEINGTREAIAGEFVLLGQNEVGFQVGAYDSSLSLTIDPVLVYSTYLGGNVNDGAYALALDGSGNCYLTGATNSANFPTTTGAYQLTNKGYPDVFVSKMNATGTALIYSTYFGGSGGDWGTGIGIDVSGDAYIAGYTASTDLPVTAGALQSNYGGGNDDTFVAKFNASGSALSYSTYLGGSGADYPHGFAVDSAGNAYVVGLTTSSNFPTTTGALEASFNTALTNSGDGFVAKLNPTGSALVYGTYLGGSNSDVANAVAVDGSGNAYVTGGTSSTDFPTTAGAYQTVYRPNGDAFVVELNSVGTALVFGTYFGGPGGTFGEGGQAIALDGAGDVYIAGQTDSASSPTSAGALQTQYGSGNFDAFVSKFNATGTTLDFSTFLGGNGDDSAYGIAVDAAGDSFITGETSSTNFPVTANAYQANFGGGTNDAFVSALNPTGSALFFSTYFGGASGDSGNGIGLDSSGSFYVAGTTGSNNFPATPGAYQTTRVGTDKSADAFLAKFNVPLTLPDTTTTVTASVKGFPVSQSTYGTAVTFAATVSPAAGSAASTGGSVDFKEGSIDLGTIAANTVSGQNDIFTLVTTPTQLKVIQSNGGVNKITAVYSSGNDPVGSIGTLAGGMLVAPAPLTITAKTNTKNYDSTSSAAAAPMVSGLQGNDTVTGSAEVYSDANVGSSKTISISGYTINDGNGGQDYAVSVIPDSTGVINQAPLTISGLTTGSWSTPSAMVAVRIRSSTTLLANGLVLVVGGYAGGTSSTTQATAELYNPATNMWSAAASMATPRWMPGTTLLPNGKVLVVGGGATSGSALASAELYDPVTNTWSTAGNMSAGRWLPSTILLQNGKVLVAGGTFTTTAAQLYDPATNTWSSAGSLPLALQGQRAVLLPNGQVLVTGGEIPNEQYVASCELYNPTTNTWTSAAPMANIRSEHSITLLQNGQVLVAGGFTGSFVGTAISSAELYNPATNTWSSAGSLTVARARQAAVVLAGGQVLVMGGENTTGALASAELYAPSSNTWSAVAAMATSRDFLTSTLLPNGKVLVDGGNASSHPGNSQLFSPGPIPTAKNKVYDSTPAATLNLNSLVLSGVYSGDTVTLSTTGAIGTFVSKNVGTNISVTTSGFTIGGPQAGNYSLVQPTTTANITPAPLTVTATPNAKSYDGTTFAAGVPTVSGLLGSDTAIGLTEVYGDAHAGSSKTLSVSAYSINDGNSGNNYTVTTVSNTPGVIINPIDHFVLAPTTSSATAGVGFAMLIIAENASNQPVNYGGPVTLTSNDPQMNSEGTVMLSGGYAAAVVTLDTATSVGWTVTATVDTISTGSSALTVSAGAATDFLVTRSRHGNDRQCRQRHGQGAGRLRQYGDGLYRHCQVHQHRQWLYADQQLRFYWVWGGPG